MAVFSPKFCILNNLFDKRTRLSASFPTTKKLRGRGLPSGSLCDDATACRSCDAYESVDCA